MNTHQEARSWRDSCGSAVFVTQRLQLAIFLHATNRLPFDRCEANPSGKINFLFGDSQCLGSQAELEFDQGATVSAANLFASQKYLRRKMTEAIENQKNGKSSWPQLQR
jgi:hypothetical protein